MLGLTDAEIGKALGVTEVTVNVWKTEHPSFDLALKDGRINADAKVARALYRRAIGMSVPKTHISNHQGVITRTEIREYYPPDVTACNSWLNNRRRQNWQRTPLFTESDDVPVPVKIEIKVKDASKK